MIRSLVDWIVVAAALVASAAWMWATDLGERMGEFGLGMAAVLIVAMAVLLSACMALTRPALTTAEVGNLLLGVLMVALPWLFGFTESGSGAMTVWITGGVIAVMGLIGIPLSGVERRKPVAA